MWVKHVLILDDVKDEWINPKNVVMFSNNIYILSSKHFDVTTIVD